MRCAECSASALLNDYLCAACRFDMKPGEIYRITYPDEATVRIYLVVEGNSPNFGPNAVLLEGQEGRNNTFYELERRAHQILNPFSTNTGIIEPCKVKWDHEMATVTILSDA